MAFMKRRQKTAFEGGGLVLFSEVTDAMRAEKALSKAGYTLKLVAPPPHLRKGCDLALEINLVEKPGIERVLEERDINYVSVTPLKAGTSRLLEFATVTDFGKWVMVKSANMKLTFDKETGTIVNTSGGGCPDIPFLHSELIDKPLNRAPRPRDIGFTLCALMLDNALDESITIYQGEKEP